MNKREAIRILQVRDEKRMKQLFGLKFAEALAMGIDALKRMPDFKKLAAAGAKAQKVKYGPKQMSKWGKMGGAPQIDEAIGKAIRRDAMRGMNITQIARKHNVDWATAKKWARKRAA